MSKKRGVKFAAVALTAALGVFFIQRSFAAAGQIFISPASKSVQKGSNVTVDVRINPGGATDGVEATIGYDASKLQFVSSSGAGSPYTIELTNTGGSGTVSIARGILGGTVSANNSLVAKVTFKALAGSGSAVLDLSGNSTTGGAYNGPAATDGTISFTTPVVTPPPTTPNPPSNPDPDPDPTPSNPNPPSSGGGSGGGSGGSGSGGSGGGSSTPTTPTTNPGEAQTTASKRVITLRKLLYKRAVFQITGPKPFSTYIKYGVGDQLNFSTKPTKFRTKHTVSLNNPLLVPGTTYSYVVVTTNAAGKVEQTETRTLKTKGYTVSVTVTDKQNRPLKNQMVTLHSDPITARTNSDGLATFEDVPPGNHTLEFEQNGKKASQPIEVLDSVVITANAEVAEPQTFAVVFEHASSGLPTGLIAALAGIAGLLIIAFVLARSGKLAAITNRNNRPGPGVGMGGPTIQGGGPDVPHSAAQSQSQVDDMLSRVPGAGSADPGSVISPNENDNK